MSDKSKKYSDIRNDKSLINRMPNENDLARFEEWKKAKTKKTLHASVAFGIFIVLFFPIISYMLKETIFIILFYILLIAIEYIIINAYLNTKKWKMEYCNYGKIIDKYVVEESGSTRQNEPPKHFYYLIVAVNESKFKFRVPKDRYMSLEIDDEATVFSVEGTEMISVMEK